MQSLLDLAMEEHGLSLRLAMHDHIVRIALEGSRRVAFRHPEIEHVMQEDVGQQGRGHAALRRSPVS